MGTDQRRSARPRTGSRRPTTALSPSWIVVVPECLSRLRRAGQFSLKTMLSNSTSGVPWGVRKRRGALEVLSPRSAAIKCNVTWKTGGGSPGNRTLNLRIKRSFPQCFRRLSTLRETVHRRRSYPQFALAKVGVVSRHFMSRACRNRVATNEGCQRARRGRFRTFAPNQRRASYVRHQAQACSFAASFFGDSHFDEEGSADALRYMNRCAAVLDDARGRVSEPEQLRRRATQLGAFDLPTKHAQLVT